MTIPTNPMSGSETNADVQITLDGTGLQAGCPMGKPVLTWLNPVFAVTLPNKTLTYGQMTAFVQLSINYLNLSRSPLAEHYAVASMQTILECLRRSLADALPHHAGHGGITGRYDRGCHHRQPRITEIYTNK